MVVFGAVKTLSTSDLTEKNSMISNVLLFYEFILKNCLPPFGYLM